jgi:sialic acid synthase SpsE
MNEIKIGKKNIGNGTPCFIIAEIGSNHNGDIEVAKKLIDISHEAGADAVKFQIFNEENLYSKYTPKFTYLKEKNVYDLIKEIKTPREWIKELYNYCLQKNIEFLATPFDYEAVDLLDNYVNAFKLASFEIVDLELIKYIAKKNKPIIISTGMANLGEIEDAINSAKSVGNENIILMQCNSVYPTPPEIVNLKTIKTMEKDFLVPVGFSDHTKGIHIPIAAIVMGAKIIEKHITLDRKMKGPDHSFAIEPTELKEMVSNIRDVEKSIGNGIKEKSTLESQEMYLKARRSIHAKVDISEGKEITKEMLTVKRPGYGIKPKFIDILVGSKAKRDIKEDIWITWDMIQ